LDLQVLDLQYEGSAADAAMSVPPSISDFYLSSRRFRERAEEARVIAGTYQQPEMRDLMLSIAAGYDRMAEHIERDEATRRDGPA